MLKVTLKSWCYSFTARSFSMVHKFFFWKRLMILFNQQLDNEIKRNFMSLYAHQGILSSYHVYLIFLHIFTIRFFRLNLTAATSSLIHLDVNSNIIVKSKIVRKDPLHKFSSLAARLLLNFKSACHRKLSHFSIKI